MAVSVWGSACPSLGRTDLSEAPSSVKCIMKIYIFDFNLKRVGREAEGKWGAVSSSLLTTICKDCYIFGAWEVGGKDPAQSEGRMEGKERGEGGEEASN